MNEKLFDQTNLRVIVLLILLQLISVYLIWTLNPVSQIEEAVFALFLSVSLVSASIISYFYRVNKRGERASRGWLLTGFCMILLILFGGLFFGV